MKIAISLLTLNNLERVKQTLTSLFQSDIKNHEIFLTIWINGLEPRTQLNDYYKFLNQFECVKENYQVLSIFDNNGIVLPRIAVYCFIQEYAKIYEKSYDYLLEIHDDMLFPDIWIDELLKHDNPNNAILMPFIVDGIDMESSQQYINHICKHYRKDKVYTNLTQNHPWLVRFDVLNKIGYYNAEYHPQIAEDDDFYYRVITSGYKTITSKNSVVIHRKNDTRERVLGLSYFNLNLFQQKYGLTVFEFKDKYLFSDDDDKDLYGGQFGWIVPSEEFYKNSLPVSILGIK